ncbi:MAG TPA: hypothetical protein VD995_26660 [Azospirillum sp.]|nr:hypothetical protein [Azospirillum sp.]
MTARDVQRIATVAPDVGPPAPGACGTLVLSGEIRPEDHAALLALLDRSGPYAAQLLTAATGGNTTDALRIGQLVRERMLATMAPLYRPDRATGVLPGACTPGQECACAGACFLVWAAGIERHGDHVLLHQLPGGADPTVRAHLADMEVPPAYADTIAALGPKAVLAVSAERLEADLKGPAPSLGARVDAVCGTYDEAERIDRLALRAKGSRRTPADGQRLALLEEKITALDRCRADTLTGERVRRRRTPIH